jgi:hypothetical protein
MMQPTNGAQARQEAFIALTSSGPELTPHRVTVIKNGQLVRQEDFTSIEDARHLYEQELRSEADFSHEDKLR